MDCLYVAVAFRHCCRHGNRIVDAKLGVATHIEGGDACGGADEVADHSSVLRSQARVMQVHVRLQEGNTWASML